MHTNQMIDDILVAIKSVRTRALEALEDERMQDYGRLMGDLIALEVCLVNEMLKVQELTELAS